MRQMQRDAESQQVILTVRPLAHRLRLAYLVFPILFVAGLIVPAIWPDGLGWAFCFFVWALSIPAAAWFIRWYMELRFSVYTITREYVAVESDMGSFGRYSRRIPVAYIRDVTIDASPVQQHHNLGSVTVSAANGDRITFEDIPNADAVREAIWRLVEQAASR